MIEFIIDPDKLDQITVEEAEKHNQFINEMNYLIEEGFITVEQGIDGQIRFYPT